jgi:hypothetical protein
MRKQKPIYNKAPLTDTESIRMSDLMKKNYINPKPKQTYLTSKVKSSAQKLAKSKIMATWNKTVSNSRSPNRDNSQSSSSNKKIKSTLASTDFWRSHALRNSGESMSISSEKPKAAYFRNTLDSHNKIGPNTAKTRKFILVYFRITIEKAGGSSAKREAVL